MCYLYYKKIKSILSNVSEESKEKTEKQKQKQNTHTHILMLTKINIFLCECV